MYKKEVRNYTEKCSFFTKKIFINKIYRIFFCKSIPEWLYFPYTTAVIKKHKLINLYVKLSGFYV
jgi:hypothetical protein